MLYQQEKTNVEKEPIIKRRTRLDKHRRKQIALSLKNSLRKNRLTLEITSTTYSHTYINPPEIYKKDNLQKNVLLVKPRHLEF
jgi:hypothetical protein